MASKPQLAFVFSPLECWLLFLFSLTILASFEFAKKNEARWVQTWRETGGGDEEDDFRWLHK